MVIYYNRDLFDKLGLKEPETYDEFLNICETLKSNNVIPIAFGNRDKWPATNTLSYLISLTAPKAKQEEVFLKILRGTIQLIWKLLTSLWIGLI